MPLTDEQKRGIIEENRQIIAQLQERASFIGPREKRKPSLSDVFRSPDPFKTGLEALGVPGGLQKEAIAAKGFVTFPYDLMKDIVLPTYKGTAKALYTLPTKGFGAAQKVVEEEVKPHQQQAIQMAKAFGGGVLDWMKMSLLPDTPAGIVAKQRIGDRIKEHGYLAEAVHPAVLLGLVRGGAKRFTTKKPSPLAERLGAIEKSEIGVPRKVIEERLKGIEEIGVPPKVEPVVKKAVSKKIVVGKKQPSPVSGIPKEVQHLDWKAGAKRHSASNLDEGFWDWYNRAGKEGAAKQGVAVRKNWQGEWYAYTTKQTVKAPIPGKEALALKKKLKAEGVGEAPAKAWDATILFDAKTRRPVKLRDASGGDLPLTAENVKGKRISTMGKYAKAIDEIGGIPVDSKGSRWLPSEYPKQSVRLPIKTEPPSAPAGKPISPRREADLKTFADRSIDQVEAGKPAGRTFVWPEAGERGPIQPRITADASTYPQWYRDLTRDYSIKKSQTIKALKLIKEKGMEADGRQYVENVKASILEAMTEERSVYAQEILKERAKRGVLTPVEKELHAFFEKKGKAFSKALKLKEEVKAKPGGKQTNLMGLYDRALAEHEMAKPLKKVTGTKAIKEEMLGRPEGEVLPGQESLRLLGDKELTARREALPKYKNDMTPEQITEGNAIYREQARRYDKGVEKYNAEAAEATGLKHGDVVERTVSSAFGGAETFRGKVIKDRNGRLAIRTTKAEGTGRKTFPINKAWKKPTPKPPAGKAAGKDVKLIQSLRQKADALQKQIDAKRSPAIADQIPTARRSRIAAGIMADAEHLERIQYNLRSIADARDAGSLPESLSGIRTKADVEGLMQYREMPPNREGWFEDHKRVVKMGIDNAAKFDRAKRDLAELGEGLKKSPEEIRQKQIAEKRRELQFRKEKGFFVTPKALAETMARRADIKPGESVLEPSAGLGNIADALPKEQTKVIEWGYERREFLKLKDYDVVGDDFLQHTKKYDKIVMNPPFENLQDITHVRHAYESLKPGGKVVSIMGEAPFFRGDKKAVEFRSWLESVDGTSEKLPPGTFKEAGTGAAARLVEIEKPVLAEYPELGKKGRIGKAKTALDAAEKKALDRIKKRGTRLTAGIDPAEMADLAIIGAAKIAKGTIKFGEWSAEMVREYGARVKPYLKRIYARSQQGASRLKANAELDSFLDYFEDIQAPKGLRPPRKPTRAAIRERLREEGLSGKELTTAANAEFIVEVNRYGIALRQTKGGKVQPAIREAGTYVPEDFATYPRFKDAKAGIFGGTKDATRFIQEIDGALSVEAKAKLSGQAGPAERYVLHRTRDMVKSKLRWTNAMKSRLATITKGASKKQLQTANQVIEHISREGAYVDPAKLVTNPKISAITKDVKVVRLAQEGRKLYESLLRHQNELRRLRGQTEIPHRDYYTAHSIHETTIWERALGHDKTPKQTIGPGLPDYIKPNAPFNARAMAREVGLPETVREMNLQTLLERYIETAGKDIYNTSIIQNNKAFIQQLESMGYRHAARGLENWTAEAFGGVKGAIDRAANLSPTIHKGMSRFRQGLIRSVFPLNFAWNTFVQTSSGVLTYARYGNRNSIRGLYDWFGSRKIRQEIRDNAYSAIIKSQRSGRISRQDINRGVGAAQRLSRGKLEKVSDAANFFTEWVERHLTGWSVATARRHGAAKGLKGKALWEYASDGGAKTQSMYNLEDLPGMLRSELIKTGGPFQTFSFEVFNTLREFAGKVGTPPATTAIRIKMALRFLAGATAVNYIGQAAIGRKPWELSSFIPFYGAFFAPVSAALRGEDVSMTSTRGLPSPIGIAIKGGQAVHRGVLKPGVAATKELIRTGDMNEALEEFMATGKWDKLRRFTIRYLSGFAGIPGGTQMNRVVDGLIAVSAGGMVDSAGRMMFPITDTKDKMRTFLAGPWASKGGQEYWDKRGKELDLYIESLNENPLLRDVVESLPVVSDVYKFGPDSPAIRGFNTFFARSERKTKKLKELETQEEKAKYYQENKAFFRKVGEKPSGEKVYLPQALRTIDRKISKHRKQIRDIESGTVMVDKKPVKLTDKQKRLAISNLKQKIEVLAKAALKLRSTE